MGIFDDDLGDYYGVCNDENGSTNEQCDLDIMSTTRNSTIAISDSSRKNAVAESTRNIATANVTRKKCIFLGMAWVMEDDASIPALLIEANTKQNWALCPYRDAARMIKALDFGFMTSLVWIGRNPHL